MKGFASQVRTFDRRWKIALSFVLCCLLLGSGCATTHQPPIFKGSDVTACFYDFTNVYAKRIYPVLLNAPGVIDLWRANDYCPKNQGCLCYNLLYAGPVEKLEVWIMEELPISRTAPFTMENRRGDFLEVYHDGGFD